MQSPLQEQLLLLFMTPHTPIEHCPSALARPSVQKDRFACLHKRPSIRTETHQPLPLSLMPNHSEQEKERIRALTKQYLPSCLAQKEARRNCPHGSLHLDQASYGQKHFENVGLVFEIVSDLLNFFRPPSTNSDIPSVVLRPNAISTAPR